MRLERERKAPHAWQIFVGFAPEAATALARAGAYIASRLGAVPE